MTQEFLALLKAGIPLDKELAPVFLGFLESLKKLDCLEIKKDSYFLKKSYLVGRFEPTREGYGFVVPLLKGCSKDWLVEKYLIKNAQKGDIVLCKNLSKRFKSNERIRAKIIKVLESKEKFVLAYLEKYKLDCIAISIPNEITYKIKASQKSLKTLPSGTLLKLNPQNGEILEILGALSDAKIDEKISLMLFNKQENFSLESEIFVKTLPQKLDLKKYKERLNLTHLPFYVIDPLDAKDHDDAIFYDRENSLLYVAIADVSHYVKEDSALDKDAKERGFSIYFPHKSIPMLPRVLSENLCSLKENENRLAFVWKMRLHKSTKAVLSAQLFEAVIKVAKKFDYDFVDKILENENVKGVKKSVIKDLQDLFVLTQKLRKNRLKKGFDFANEEQRILLDSNFELKGIKQEIQSASHSLIEECMLLANIQSALLLEQKSTQNDKNLKLGIYRVHAKPKVENLEDLFYELRLLGLYKEKYPPKNMTDFHSAILEIQKLAKKLKIQEEVDKLIIKSMQQASYASHNIGHFGLGFEAYSHFTSPIRRYSDLILHRILKAKITMQENLNTKNSLPEICERLSVLEREATKVEMDFKDRKFARFLEKKIGSVFEGIIINDAKPLLVAINQAPLNGARAVILKGSGVKYQKVKVEIIEANIAMPKIYGRIVFAYSDEGFGLNDSKIISKYLFTKNKDKKAKEKEQAKNKAKSMQKRIQKSNAYQKNTRRKKRK